MRCIGRFAPSPTGDLHLGSLTTAVGSRLEALRQHGDWHLRIEDLDTPRVVPGSASRLLALLESLGFEWTGAVEYQSTHAHRYALAIEALDRLGLLFACACTRRSRAAAGAEPGDEPGCVGRCRDLDLPRAGHSLRFAMPDAASVYAWEDRLQGPQQVARARYRDVVVLRRDDIVAYQLAVVVDDAALGVTDVVRGADLQGSTPWQRGLQHALGLAHPALAHLPVVVEPDGSKLAKSRRSVAVDAARPSAMLGQALTLLQHAPPSGHADWPVAEMWAWAEANWRPGRLAGLRTVAVPA